MLEKIKALEAAKEAAKKALVKRTKELQVDLVKCNQIVSAKLDNKIELAAWEVLSSKYPEWTQNINPGDTTAFAEFQEQHTYFVAWK